MGIIEKFILNNALTMVYFDNNVIYNSGCLYIFYEQLKFGLFVDKITMLTREAKMPTFENFHFITTKGNKVKDFGLHYLSSVAREDFDQAIKPYDDAEFYGLALSGRKKKDYKEAFDKAIVINDNEAIKKNLRDLSRDTEISFDFFTRQAYSQFLSRDEIWTQWENEIGETTKKLKIRYLKDRWLKHGKFSHYSSDALLFSAHILDALATHMIAAKKEFQEKSHRLPKNERKGYLNYLNRTLIQIRNEKQTLCWAMYARLEAACRRGDASFDDVTATVKSDLSELGIRLEEIFRSNSPKPSLRKTAVINKDEEKEVKILSQKINVDDTGLKTQPDVLKGSLITSRGMSSQTAATFGKCIDDNGTDNKGNDFDVKKELKSLTWFNSSNSLPLTVIRAEHQCYFIPESFKKLIPSAPRKPEWLFQGHNKRFRYFQSQSSFLQALALLSNINLNISDKANFKKDPVWRKLEAMKALAKQKVEDARNQFPSRGWRAFFQKETRNFYQVWNKELLKQQELILFKQIEFLSLLIPNGQPVEHLIAEYGYFSGKTRVTLIENLNTLQEDVVDAVKRSIRQGYMQQGISSENSISQEQLEGHELFKRFKEVDRQLVDLIEKDNKIIYLNDADKRSAENTLEKLASGSYDLNQEDINQTFDYYRKIDVDQSINFCRKNEGSFTNIQIKLESILIFSHKQFKQENFKSKISFAIQCAEVLDKLALHFNNKTLLPVVKQFLLDHKKFAESEYFEGKSDVMKQINDLIKTVFIMMSNKGIEIAELQKQMLSIYYQYNKKLDPDSLAELQIIEKQPHIIQAEIDLQLAQDGLLKSRENLKHLEESHTLFMKELSDQREKHNANKSSLQAKLAFLNIYLEKQRTTYSSPDTIDTKKELQNLETDSEIKMETDRNDLAKKNLESTYAQLSKNEFQKIRVQEDSQTLSERILSKEETEILSISSSDKRDFLSNSSFMNDSEHRTRESIHSLSRKS